MSSLPIAQYCGQAPRLSAIGHGRTAALSTCFHGLCSGDPRAKDQFAMLQPEEQAELMTWKKPTDVDVRTDESSGVILRYADAEKELALALNLQGNPCAPDEHDATVLTIGHLDFAWVVEPDRGLRMAYVADIKRSEYTTPDGPNSLQLHAYGMAYALLRGCECYCTGIWAAVEGRWEWLDKIIQLDSPEAAQIYMRVMAAARNTSEEYSMGSHCSGCYGRMRCPAYLLPPNVAEQLRPLTGAEITPHAVTELLLSAKRAKDAVSLVEDWCKEYVRHGGTITNGNGKRYRPISMPGRESLDREALEREMGDLSKFTKTGKSYEQWKWGK